MSVSKGGDNIGLVWRKFYTSKLCQFDVCSHHSLTSPVIPVLSPCFYTIPIFTILIRRIFYLSAFLFTAFKCMVCIIKGTFWGIMPIKKCKTLVALSYRLRRFVVIYMFLVHQCTKFHCRSTHHKQVIGTNTI